MKQFCLILFLIAIVGYSPAQYKGSIGDGFSFSIAANQNGLPNIFHGSSNDGFSFSSIASQNSLPNIYHGGSSDGFSISSIANQNSLPNIYQGGSSDGFTISSSNNQNLLPNIYNGGNSDGFSISSVNNQNILPNIYNGGSSDGFSISTALEQNCTLDSARWNGSTSNIWSDPNNWDCKVLPNINCIVIIPSGLSRYPIVFFSYEIKGLYMHPGSSLLLQTGVIFKLNGH